MRKVAIYSDYTLTFTAYQTRTIAKSDVVVDLSEADWAEYQRIETTYAEWQQRLERLINKRCETRVEPNARKMGAKVKAG